MHDFANIRHPSSLAQSHIAHRHLHLHVVRRRLSLLLTFVLWPFSPLIVTSIAAAEIAILPGQPYESHKQHWISPSL